MISENFLKFGLTNGECYGRLHIRPFLVSGGMSLNGQGQLVSVESQVLEIMPRVSRAYFGPHPGHLSTVQPGQNNISVQFIQFYLHNFAMKHLL